jgi:peptidoglycan/xylan/chitin deacetylase (PgdA/CDA1 family)
MIERISTFEDAYTSGTVDVDFGDGIRLTLRDSGVQVTNTARITALEAVASTPRANKGIVSNMFAGHGWGAGPTTNATFNLDDTTDYALGDRCVTVTTDGTAASGYVQRTGLNLDLTGKGLTFWVKATNMQSISSVSVTIGNSDTYAPSWFAALPLTYGFKSPATEGEWFAINLSPGNFGVNNGAPTRTGVTAIRVTLAGRAGMPAPTLKIGGLATYGDKSNNYPKGVVSLTFDDTWAAGYDAARKMGQYAFPGTAYLIQSRVDDVAAGRLTMAQLRNMQDTYGWEIGAHCSVEEAHVDWTQQTTAWVEAELATMKQWQTSNNFPTETFAYPIGPFNADLARRTRKQYSSARSTYPSTNSPTRPHAHRLSTYVIAASTTLASAKIYVDRVVANGGWLVLMFHNLVASAPTGNDWLKSDFDILVDYVAATGLPVATVGEVVRQTA